MTKPTQGIPVPSAEGANAQHLLVTSDVTVRYDHVHEALHPVSLSFDAGTCTALIGPSGCGKSTFLRCLNLMNREIARCDVDGSIFYHDRDINTPTENLFELRKSIGMVFQQPTPFRKSIRENILFAPKRHGRISGKEEADELVESSLRQAALWDEVKDKLALGRAAAASLHRAHARDEARRRPLRRAVLRPRPDLDLLGRGDDPPAHG